MPRLAGKVAIVTGAAAGIGLATARLFVREGARVLLVDVDESALKSACDGIGRQSTAYAVADVTQVEDVQRFIRVACESFGGVDVFVSNAGIEGVIRPIDEYPIDVFERVMAVNVTGTWLGLRYIIPVMREKGGSIVITSSISGLRGAPGISAYTASKHAAIGIMRVAALECAKWNIRVNAVNPSPVETRMMRSLENMRSVDTGGETTAETVKTTLANRIPLGRYGTPEEVAALMLFLAGDESKFCTGGTYMVDGGMSAGAV